MANQGLDSGKTVGSNNPDKRENEDIEQGEVSSDEKGYDSNIVDWDGPNDPANPMNWSALKKGLHIAYVSLFVLYANLAATMFAPGASELAKEFHVTNSTVATFTVSIYVLGFMVGPLFLAPLSELYGRLAIYHICNIFYICFTLGCALSKDVSMFLVFRILAGCSSAGPLTIGGGTIADVTPQDKRGKAMASFLLGPLLGPTIGPIVGGFVSQYIGWRWTFWIILILVRLDLPHCVRRHSQTNLSFIVRQSQYCGSPILKGDKRHSYPTEKDGGLRKETGNSKLTSKLESKLSPRELFARSIVRPIKMVTTSPITLLLSLYTGVIFGLIFLLFTTFPSIFEGQYGFSAGSSGLAYLGLGIGMICGLALFTLLSDKLLGQTGSSSSSKPAKPEKRLILMKWFAPITPLGVFLYGWSAYYKVHWIVPEIGTFIVGIGSLFVMLPCQTYLVDAFGPQAAASALAANVIIRSPFGAFLTFAAPPLYDNLGLGWGNTVLGFICFAFTPVPWLFYHYGEYLRTHFAVKV